MSKLRGETKGKLRNNEFISPNTFRSGTIQVLESTMQKPTLALLGHPTMKLGKFIQSRRPRAWEKNKGVTRPLDIRKYGLGQFVTSCAGKGAHPILTSFHHSHYHVTPLTSFPSHILCAIIVSLNLESKTSRLLCKGLQCKVISIIAFKPSCLFSF